MTALQNLFLLNTLINLQLLYACRIYYIHVNLPIKICITFSIEQLSPVIESCSCVIHIKTIYC